MLFHTGTFIIFFAITVTLLTVLRRHSTQKNILLVASIIFYMWWNPAFILLILYSSVIDFFVARKLDRTEHPAARRGLILISLVTNLGLLAFFKYFGFFEQNMLYAFRAFGYKPNWVDLHIVLPVGISFYTFQTLSYTIDVYRRQIRACQSFRDLSLFVMFFPQLVAGPIARASDFLPQLEKPAKMNFDRESLFLFLRGLVKKALIADGVSAFADAIFRNPTGWSSGVIWLAALCFYVQIYCDFSGYSDMAIAIARMLGYRLTLNFDRPYFAPNPSNFWRRWHISLSSWLRDYLYIPLGGNRSGGWKATRNLMLTMLIGGFWHGASWNFILWGGLHGAALVVHRFWRSLSEGRGWRAWLDRSRAYHLISILAMQYFVILTWIPFRVVRTDHMLYALRKFVIFDGNLRLSDMGLGSYSPVSTLLMLLAFFALHIYSNLVGGIDLQLARMRPLPAAILCLLIGAIVFLLWPTVDAPFIYFQF